MSWITHDFFALVSREELGNSSKFVLAFVAIIVGGFALVQWQRNRREEESREGAMVRVATELGLEYQLGRDTSIPIRYLHIQRLSQGKKQYASNVINGNYKGHTVCVFDYHYTTTSSRNTGLEDSPEHHSTVFIIHVEATFPELFIAGDGPFTSLAQTSGHPDIDFESREFSDKYYVGSESKQFAYAICHPRMMELLLANPVPSLEFENDTVALTLNRLLNPERIRIILDRLVNIRLLIPEYLLTKH